ncbi:MAG: hypothetical protein VKO65_01440 [Cyanobacteriota bacterium]|nr:hypothetical protein [Cyanobacteriota bacterium]
MGFTSSHSPPPLDATGSGAGGCCPRCGGSGMLRHGDQRFRTCLDCLGQGRLLAEPLRELVFRPISVSASASVAR